MQAILDRGGVILSVIAPPDPTAVPPGGPRPSTDVTEPAGGYMAVTVDGGQGAIQRTGLKQWRVAFRRLVGGVEEQVVVQTGNCSGADGLAIANAVTDGPPPVPTAMH
jgi:hypothetical protein